MHFQFVARESLELSVERTYEHTSTHGWTDSVSLPVADSRLMQLTNREVVGAAVETSQRLRLTFEHGQELVVIDDTDDYESFQISYGERLWVF